jgi:hypothetical protein
MNTKIAKKQKLINCSLVGLLGRNIKGIKAQVTNPIYIGEDCPEAWRTLNSIRSYTERGQLWVELYWIREDGDSCNFTGCTQKSDMCTIQFTHAEFNKMLQQSTK